MSDYLTTLEPMVQTLAHVFAANNRAYGADAEDFAQEMRLWIVAHESKLAEWFESGELEEKHALRKTVKALRNECRDYAVDIKAQSVGYHRSDLYYYTKGELRNLLPAMFNREEWLHPPQSDGRTTKALAEGNNWIATLSDLARAFDTLGAEDRNLLHALHGDGWTQRMYAEMTQTPESSVSYRHDRAVHRLNKALGEDAPRPARKQSTRDPWRGRHAVSSARARYDVEKGYDGD